ncbi:pentapeptide repeat-containing protein [Mycolicibacterium fluoranthenivorans]|nr:pentapeptide repeat-containing protein [Mycolicibacterium fluoranthenivorans]MCV7355896.1 pentapeptide repeat-containing protein [Mycolicibacterium fluoranthenivorans]
MIERLADDLTPRQRGRLAELAESIGDDGMIAFSRALEVTTTGSDERARQAAFRQFRKSVRSAASAVGVAFSIEVDGQKIAPTQRRCWFEGTDMAEARLTDMARHEASRGAPSRPVGAHVQEVFDGPPNVLVHACAASEHEHDPKLQEFVGALTTAMAVRSDRQWTVTSDLDIRLGIGNDELMAGADIVVVLVSPALLGGDERQLSRIVAHRRVILVPYYPLPRGPLKKRGLNLDHLLTGKAWCASTPAERRSLLDQVVREITVEADRPMGNGRSAGRSIEQWVLLNTQRRGDVTAHVPGTLRETSLESAAVGLSKERHLGDPTPAIDRLLDWAAGTDEPRLCALLGDVGTGKTTTAKLLTQRLLDERRTSAAVPMPLYFDLRDVPKRVIVANPTLREILDAVLRGTEDTGPHPTVDDVVTCIRQGQCLVIFDGLDEVLVHLPPQEQQLFTRTLWRATADLGSTTMTSDRLRSKLLLTCRTHFFRSIRDEATHFSGQDRESAIGRDHLALLMVPFTEPQIRAYIAANVPDVDVDAVIATIDATHNLRELATRPLTLRMITEQLEYIEQARLDGRTVRAVDLYGAIVSRWLARDEGKHCLLPQHKVLLMEHLAADLWRTGRSGWDIADVEQWLVMFLHSRSDLELHYPQRMPDQWKDDLRTATFLVRRDDDTFEFAHTSLREYFLSQYLVRALTEFSTDPDRLAKTWTMPIPSRETLDFLGQSFAGLAKADRANGFRALASLSGRYQPEASELTFAYGLMCHDQGYPVHRMAAAVLDGAKLRGICIDAPPSRPLDLSGISLRGADLRDAVIRNVRLRNARFDNANLTLSEIHDCDLSRVSLQSATLIGTVFRRCSLGGIDCVGATVYRAQNLRPERTGTLPQPGWLVEHPAAQADPRLSLRSLIGYRGPASAVAYSPNGARLVTAGDDGFVRVWDGATGEGLLTLAGHHGSVSVVIYSPDGSRVVSSGYGTRRRASYNSPSALIKTESRRWPTAPTGPSWPVPAKPMRRRASYNSPSALIKTESRRWPTAPTGPSWPVAGEPMSPCGCGTPPPASHSSRFTASTARCRR